MSSSSSSALTAPWTPQPPELSPEWWQMCTGRHAHLQGLDAWLVKRPDPDLAREEVHGTLKAIRDIAWLHGIVLT